MIPFLFLGGRLHGEERLMDDLKPGEERLPYIDILSAETYYPRVVGIAAERDALGQPTSVWEITLYLAEQIADVQGAMAALTDIIVYQYFKLHGTPKATPQVPPNRHGLIVPG